MDLPTVTILATLTYLAEDYVFPSRRGRNLTEMDLPLVNESSFTSANPSSYTLAGIWALSSITEGVENGCVLGPRMRQLAGVTERDGSIDESTVTDQSLGNGGRRKRKNHISDDVSSQGLPSEKSNDKLKDVMEPKSEAGFADKVAEPPKDYIHVRARRGQATDSHSLAERARREKISERMKTLQDLVPGCNKVIGKALVLDEIINYIQSLQRQVEFLSIKLEAVNSTPIMNIEGVHQKETMDATGVMSCREYSPWLHML